MSDFNKVRVKMIRVPFNYHWPRSAAVSVVRELGPCLIDGPIAEAAIDQGYAVPFNPTVSKPAPRRRSASTKVKDEDKVVSDATDAGKSSDMDRDGLADDGGSENQPPMDDAG